MPTSEIVVGLSDYLLALECLAFAWLLSRIDAGSSPLRRSVVAFFLFIAIASLTGGTWHLLFSQSSSVAATVSWKATMLAVGATALAGWSFGARLVFGEPARRRVTGAALLAYAVYSIYVIVVDDDFRVAIAGYAPAVAFLGVAFAISYRRYAEPAILLGLSGLAVTVVAAIVEMLEIPLHPLYFNHDATYHLIQAIGLFLIFRATVFFVRDQHSDCCGRRSTHRPKT